MSRDQTLVLALTALLLVGWFVGLWWFNRRLPHKLFTEYALFSSAKAARDALDQVRREHWPTYALLVVILVPGFVVLGSFVERSIPQFGVLLQTLFGPGGMWLVGLIASLAWFCLLRRRFRRSLRRRLREQGVPICIPCGYDLTGNASGMCPECGTRVATIE
ncbi:MAG: hypothetical protein PVI86_16620 [Phycisphaerae bacterium]|jgi:hypothetical protein